MAESFPRKGHLLSMESRETTGVPGPAEQPWHGKARLPVDQIERFLTEGMPGTAIAHSYHVDALLVPELQADANFQRFSLIELNELHHQIAAMGAILRWHQGDPNAVQDLAVNLAGFLQNRQAAMEASHALGPHVTGNPAVQRVLHLVEQSNRAIERNRPALQQFTAMVPTGEPGAMLVHC